MFYCIVAHRHNNLLVTRFTFIEHLKVLCPPRKEDGLYLIDIFYPIKLNLVVFVSNLFLVFSCHDFSNLSLNFASTLKRESGLPGLLLQNGKRNKILGS